VKGLPYYTVRAPRNVDIWKCLHLPSPERGRRAPKRARPPSNQRVARLARVATMHWRERQGHPNIRAPATRASGAMCQARAQYPPSKQLSKHVCKEEGLMSYVNETSKHDENFGNCPKCDGTLWLQERGPRTLVRLPHPQDEVAHRPEHK